MNHRDSNAAPATHEYRGQILTVGQLADMAGCSWQVMNARLKRHSVEIALEMGGPRPKGSDEGSLSSRIEAFYRTNPHEWLTLDDVEVKFTCTRRQAIDAIKYLKRIGRLNLEAVQVLHVKGSA